MHHKTVFTFGTLYDERVIKALLGHVPESFPAELKGYEVYTGDKNDLSGKIILDLQSKGRDVNNFKFLFAKQGHPETQIEGKVYLVTAEDEAILDKWERFPDWYQKQEIIVRDTAGVEHAAFVYTLSARGVKTDKFARVPDDLELTIKNARSLRENFTRVHQ